MNTIFTVSEIPTDCQNPLKIEKESRDVGASQRLLLIPMHRFLRSMSRSPAGAERGAGAGGRVNDWPEEREDLRV